MYLSFFLFSFFFIRKITHTMHAISSNWEIFYNLQLYFFNLKKQGNLIIDAIQRGFPSLVKSDISNLPHRSVFIVEQ